MMVAVVVMMTAAVMARIEDDGDNVDGIDGSGDDGVKVMVAMMMVLCGDGDDDHGDDDNVDGIDGGGDDDGVMMMVVMVMMVVVM